MTSAHPSLFGKFSRIAAAALAVFALTAPLLPSESDARPGRGFSQGSRGLKTYTPPPSTNTAPGATQGVQRSATPNPATAGPATAASQAARPAAGAAAASQSSRFGTGFMAGLLGAGLFGVLLGAGLFGNLGSLTAILGLLLQGALIAGAIYLVMAMFRGRRPQPAGMQGGPRDAGYEQDRMQRSAYPGSAGGTGGATGGATGGKSRIGARLGGAGAPAGMAPLTLQDSDFTSFERLLAVVQTAYGREDVEALRVAATPEMVGYFSEEIEANVSQGVRNEIGEPKLLQGDLSEAWVEASGEYATVAMRYALTDAMVDRKSGRVVEGSRSEQQEVTEVWTFVRRVGAGPGGWRLSAIQQVA